MPTRCPFIPPRFPDVRDLLGFKQETTRPSSEMLLWLSQAKYLIHTMIKIDYFCEGTRVSTKEERDWKKGEWGKRKIEEGTEWRERMPDLRDKGIFQTIPYHYSACHVTPRHRSYKLTISQRSSILQPSLSSTIRFLLFVSLPYLLAFTRAFISTNIHHDFPFVPFLFRPSSSRVHSIHHELENVCLRF